MKLQLQNKHKKSLLVVVMILVLLLTYLYVVLPFLDKVNILKNEAISLKNQEERLIDIDRDKEIYIEETAKTMEEIGLIFAQYPAELQQERSLIFFNEIENIRFTKLQTASFTQTEETLFMIPTEETDMKEQIDALTGENPTEDPAASTEVDTLEQAKADDLMGLKTVTQYSYEAEYEDFKNFLNYIKQNGKRMVMTAISLDYDGGLVTGSFTIVEYGISGSEREPDPEVETGCQVGVNNIFDIGEASGSERAIVFNVEDTKIAEDSYDAFILLNQPEADIPPVIVGLPNDVQGESYIEVGGNSSHDITITMSGNNGYYYIRYAVGDEEAPVVSFEVGEHLDFRIISSKRFTDDDVSANVSFENKTDKELVVTIVNDDSENPRVHINELKGDVTIK